MADFDNLLGDLEEETQPTLSPSASVQDPDTNADDNNEQENDPPDAGNEANNDELNNEDGDIIPAALQEALLRQENRIYDDTQSFTQEDNEQEAGESEDYRALKKMWIHELNTTELGNYDEEFLNDLLEIMQNTDDMVEDLQEQGRTGADPTLASIAASICKMDFDRISFVLSDFMRVRLEKIEKYTLHNRDCHDRMSNMEIEYHKKYSRLFQSHLERTVTDNLRKEAWRKLDEPEMIDRPNLDTFVFCKVVGEEGIVVDNWEGMTISAEEEEEDELRSQPFDQGAHIFVRYRVVRELVQNGKVELLM
eukprot:scaffold4303_cov242-Chaetoceros_neogracile.AAC.2